MTREVPPRMMHQRNMFERTASKGQLRTATYFGCFNEVEQCQWTFIMPIRKKTIKNSRYRSSLEAKFASNNSGKGYQYEPFSLPYVMKRNYKPDFVIDDVLIECKGFFRPGDTLKYKSIRDSLPDYELVFVLSDPNKKVRKGSKLTMGQWCVKEGFKHYTLDNTDELIDYVTDIY